MVRQHPVDDLGRQVHAALGRLGGQGGQLVGVGQRIQAEHRVPAQAGAQVPRSGIIDSRARSPATASAKARPVAADSRQRLYRANRPACRLSSMRCTRPPPRTSAWATGVGAGQHAQYVLAVGGVDVDGVGARGERAQQMAAAAAGRAPYVERPAGERAHRRERFPLGPAMKLFSEGAGAGRTSSSSWRFMEAIQSGLLAERSGHPDPRHGTRAGCPAAARPRAVARPVAGAAMPRWRQDPATDSRSKNQVKQNGSRIGSIG